MCGREATAALPSIPGHSCTAHVRASLTRAAALSPPQAQPSVRPALRGGDLVLMDSALIHGGGANSLRRRALFHFSFKRPEAYPGGRFSSLLESLRGQRHLRDAARWLASDDPDGEGEADGRRDGGGDGASVAVGDGAVAGRAEGGREEGSAKRTATVPHV